VLGVLLGDEELERDGSDAGTGRKADEVVWDGM